jgi:hypothetical protein
VSVEDKERLEKELKIRVLENMRGSEELADFFSETLKNFSYRYIESDTTGEASPEWKSENTLMVELDEPTLANALKTDNQTTRKGLIELAKSFSKKDRPCVRYRLGVVLKNINNQGGGSFQVFAETHWGFPDFEDSSRRNSKKIDLNFEDALELRNNFARHLEEVCVVL